MSVLIQGDQLRTITFGRKVDRATASLPQTATGGIFVVTGGRVLVTSLVGEVTTVVQNQATTLKVVATPTTGSVNDLSGTVNIQAAAVGSLIGLTGLAGDAAVLSTGGGVSNLRNPIAVAIGTIGITTGASSTGAIKWSLTYVPFDDGASVAAA